jgi:8-oxo-dGTP pyrophosphatase MutT (NUDIX family)
MISEIREELGLNVLPSELNLIYSGREDTERVFFDIYYLKKDFDTESLTLQKEEVDFVEWDSIEKINELIANNLFLENHVEEFYRMMDILKTNKN